MKSDAILFGDFVARFGGNAILNSSAKLFLRNYRNYVLGMVYKDGCNNPEYPLNITFYNPYTWGGTQTIWIGVNAVGANCMLQTDIEPCYNKYTNSAVSSKFFFVDSEMKMLAKVYKLYPVLRFLRKNIIYQVIGQAVTHKDLLFRKTYALEHVVPNPSGTICL